ncbi:voltage-dependent T-type calcium channel subunit alpha-1G isoform X2 [Nematostella vectensis]|nr:voltage-dependent T-type calcium channel subunit alpha-1G isoform X2 [Nematostella vectensis]
MVVKMVAMGVFGSHGYLQDTWNKLDFVIIVMGVIEKSLQGSDYLTIIRAFRVLRPLRAINKVPSIRILVTLLLDTLPMLGNVLLLSFLVFFVFGIIGVQLWQGKLRNRCFASTNDTALLLSFNQSVFYKPSFIQPDFVCSGPTNTGMTSCLSDIPHSYLHGRQCTLPPENLTSNSSNCADWNSLYRDCREDGPNPFWGTISFDNIAIAWMVIFQVITLEGWSDVMYLVQDTHSFWNWIYFIILIVIGAFFLVNLCLVVITMQFQETKAREIELMEENRRRQRYRSSRFSLSCLEKLRRTFCPGRCQGEPKEHIHHHHHHIYHHHHFHHHLYDCYTPSSPGLALSSDEDKFFGQDICQPDTLQIPEITIDEGDRKAFLRPPEQLTLSRRESDTSVCSHSFSLHAEAKSSVSIDEILTTSSVTLTVPGSPSGFIAAAHTSVRATTSLPEDSILKENRASFQTRAQALATAEVNADQRCLRAQGARQRSRNAESKERIRESPTLSGAKIQGTSRNIEAVSVCSPGLSRSYTGSPTISARSYEMTDSEGLMCDVSPSLPRLRVVSCHGSPTMSRNATPTAQSPNLSRSNDQTNESHNESRGESPNQSRHSRRYSQPFGLKEVNWTRKTSEKRQKNRRLDLKELAIEELQDEEPESKFSLRKFSIKNKQKGAKNSLNACTSRDESKVTRARWGSSEDLTQDLKRDLQLSLSSDKGSLDSLSKHADIKHEGRIKSTDNGMPSKVPRDASRDKQKSSDKVTSSKWDMLRDASRDAGDFFLNRNAVKGDMFQDEPLALATTDVAEPRPNPFLLDDDVDDSVFDFHQSDSYDVSRDMGVVHRFRAFCRRMAESRHFSRLIMIAILLNMICMGLEHHNQPQALTVTLEKTNIVFVTIFVLEMIINVISFGIMGYLSQLQNIFDGFVVVLSVTELLLENGYARLSVFRSIRLLRIFKLVRPVRYQLLVVIRTMTSVVTFFGLLFLFMFAFAILGMNLFGGEFYFPNAENISVPARTSFDSFLWAMVTVFQILTQENWNQVMFKGMRATSYWAALYFIALMTVGYYVLFNLLVAILVEGFTSSGCKTSAISQDTAEASRQRHHNQADHLKAPCHRNPLTLVNNEAGSYDRDQHAEPAMDYCGHALRNALLSGASPQTRDSSKKSGKTCNSRKTSLERCLSSGPVGELSFTLPELKQMRQTSISLLRKTRRNPGSSRIPGQPVYNPAFVDDDVIKTQVQMKGFSPRKSSNLDDEDNVDDEKITEKLELETPEGNIPEACKTVFFKPEVKVKEVNKPDIKSSKIIQPKVIEPEVTYEESCEEIPYMAYYTQVGDGMPSVMKGRRQSTLVQPRKKVSVFAVRHDWSFFMFAPDNRFRQRMRAVCSHRAFDYVILVFIIFSCAVLAIEAPDIAEQGLKRQIIDISMLVFTIIFTIEMLIKLVAMGLVLGPGTYLRDGWDVLDGFLVMVSWIDIIVTYTSHVSPEVLGTLRVFRALRTLRPLRVIRRAPGLKLVVQTLLYSLKPIGNTVLIAAIFFVMFGILGVQLFKGKFYYCEGDSHVISKQECANSTRGQWVNRRYNFDDLLQALISLFVVSTKDGWVEIMHHGIDAVDVDVQPIVNYAEWRLVYFIPFLLLGGFLVLNMIVGVVVENFQRCRERMDEEEQARPHRKGKKARNQMQAEDSLYYESYGPLRLKIHFICTHRNWDITIAAIICINVICMSLEHYKMPQSYEVFVETTNYFFTSVFVIEVVVKVIALGFVRYPKDRWNLIDLAIVLLSVTGIVLELLVKVDHLFNPTVIRTLRVLRITRVLKLVKLAKGVRSLLDTLFEALPQVANLGLLFFLLFFIYSCLGIQLFGSLECSHDYPCQGFNRHAHFRDFGTAMLTLFRIATGDNWNGILKDTLRSKCEDSADCSKNCCLSRYTSPLYFVTFVLAAQFVLVNVVIAVLMKHLKESKEKIAATMAAKDIEKKLKLLTLVARNFIRAKAARKSSQPSQDLNRRRSVVELGLGGIELAQLKSHTQKWKSATLYRDVAKADAIFQEYMHLNASLRKAKMKAMRTTSNKIERTSSLVERSTKRPLQRRHTISDLNSFSPQASPSIAKRTVWKSGIEL